MASVEMRRGLDNGAPLKIDQQDLPISFRGGAGDGSRNDPWVGEKGMLTEGGVRVPYLMRRPTDCTSNCRPGPMDGSVRDSRAAH
jgi:hypothetical protein